MAGTAAGAAKRAARAAGAATPTDRQPPRKTAARVRKSTPAELDQVPPARAEALLEEQPDESELPDDGSVAVEFDGHVFEMKSPGDWRQSAQEALTQGLFGVWARGAMYPDSAALWAELDLTNRECMAFMDAFDEAFQARYGSDPKALQKRLGSRPSTPRRSR
jgi:hypothetical protein